jgi:hypothetical protein
VVEKIEEKAVRLIGSCPNQITCVIMDIFTAAKTQVAISAYTEDGHFSTPQFHVL